MSLIMTSVTLAFTETGLASVYSSRFQGSKTASGETFNHDEFTAAHRSLPFGAMIRITRSDDGRSVIVRINDRGPFVSDHVTDLSRAAALKLGIHSESDAIPVVIELLSDHNDVHLISNSTIEPALLNSEVRTKSVSNTRSRHEITSDKRTHEKSEKVIASSKSVPSSYNVVTKKVNLANPSAANLKSGLYKVVEANKNLKGKYAIQVACISNQENVEKTVDEFRKQNCTNVFVQIGEDKSGKTVYRVLLGTFNTPKSADIFLKSKKCCKTMKAFVVGL